MCCPEYHLLRNCHIALEPESTIPFRLYFQELQPFRLQDITSLLRIAFVFFTIFFHLFHHYKLHNLLIPQRKILNIKDLCLGSCFFCLISCGVPSSLPSLSMATTLNVYSVSLQDLWLCVLWISTFTMSISLLPRASNHKRIHYTVKPMLHLPYNFLAVPASFPLM